MNKAIVSETWKQLVGLNADTAEAQGWFICQHSFSPKKGWAVDLVNPKGEMVAWGYSRTAGSVRDTVLKAQAAYAAKVQS